MTDQSLQALATIEVSPDTQHEIEQFLFFEARLLDEWRWRDWYNLLTEDIHYWMPTRKNRLRVLGFTQEVTSGTEMAHSDEDKTATDSRVRAAPSRSFRDGPFTSSSCWDIDSGICMQRGTVHRHTPGQSSSRIHN